MTRRDEPDAPDGGSKPANPMRRAPTAKLLTVAAATAAVALAALVVPTLSGAAGEARATRSVTVGDIFFRPTSLTVQRGTRVRWVWRGKLGHNVTVVRGPTRFRSRTQTSGSFSRVLRRRGSYRLICTIHGAALQSMRIRVR